MVTSDQAQESGRTLYVMSVSHVSPNFTWAEVRVKQDRDCPLEWQPNARALAVHVLEPIRAAFGGPLKVVSWWRSPEHNEEVGGADRSQHLIARAADIRPSGPLDLAVDELPRLRAVIENLLTLGKLPALGGYGKYRTFVHVDCRPRKADGSIARWTGKGFAS